jgi:UMF1 family MFS transporter
VTRGTVAVPDDSRTRNAPQEIAAWLMYDWANSAFQTTVITVLAGPYLTDLAQRDVGRNGIVATLGPFGSITALSLFPYCISTSVFLQVLFLPLLGAIADYSRAKKRLMAAFCYGGVAATCLLFFISGQRYLVGGLLLVVANFAFGVTIVLYNAFLNDITTEDVRDKVSSQGYALGYLGGGLLLAANLILLSASDQLGISNEFAVRISLLSAGVWWGGYALITFARLRPRAGARARPAGRSYLALGLAGLRGLWSQLLVRPHTRRYLIAYMAFNDAIQTVISVASVFLAQELFVSRGLPTNEAFLIGLVLMVQFVAFAGALLFERIAVVLGTKNAILVSLRSPSPAGVTSSKRPMASPPSVGSCMACTTSPTLAAASAAFTTLMPGSIRNRVARARRSASTRPCSRSGLSRARIAVPSMATPRVKRI